MEELICSHESVLRTYKNPYEIERETGISRSSVQRIAKHDLAAENLWRWSEDYCHSLDGAIIFSEIVSNKFRINVRNEITLICAKFGADLVDISKVTSRKAKWPSFYEPVFMSQFL